MPALLPVTMPLLKSFLDSQQHWVQPSGSTGNPRVHHASKPSKLPVCNHPTHLCRKPGEYQLPPSPTLRHLRQQQQPLHSVHPLLRRLHRTQGTSQRRQKSSGHGGHSRATATRDGDGTASGQRSRALQELDVVWACTRASGEASGHMGGRNRLLRPRRGPGKLDGWKCNRRWGRRWKLSDRLGL